MAAKPCNTSTARRRHSGWVRSQVRLCSAATEGPQTERRACQWTRARPAATSCSRVLPRHWQRPWLPASRARPRPRCRPPGRRRQATTGSASAGSRSRHCSTVISRFRPPCSRCRHPRRRELLRAAFRPDGPIRTPVNAFAVNTGERLYLVDSGTAAGFAPGVAHLPEALAAAGLSPEAVDAVILTHLHVDHAGGLVRDGKAVYPNAQIVVADAEAAFWLDEAIEAKAPDDVKPFFDIAQSLAGALWRPGHPAERRARPRRRPASR